MMAVAGHVFDKDPPPPELVTAWDFERFGADVLSMPPGLLRTTRLVANWYGALSGYTHAAGRTVEWSRRNPDAWEFVSGVIAARKEAQNAERE